MEQSLFAQILGVFASPLGMFVLALAVLAAAYVVVFGFWKKGHSPLDLSQLKSTAKVAPPAVDPLPPQMKTGTTASVAPEDYRLRNALLIFIGGLMAFSVWEFMLSGDRAKTVDARQTAAVTEDAGQSAAAAVQPVQADYSRLICAEGVVDQDHPVSYRLCAPTQAAQFDVINLARGGMPLVDMAWTNGTLAVTAVNQATPFSLDPARVSLVPGAGADVDQYDAILALGVGMPAQPVSAEEMQTAPSLAHAAGHVSAKRSFELARFVLESLRGEKEADCQANTQVVAISLGDAATGADPSTLRPALIGVRFDERFPAGERNLDALVADFMQSQGVKITDYTMSQAQSAQTLFSEPACGR